MSGIDINRIETQLAGCIVGREISLYEKLESTMDQAKSLAEDGAAEGTVVVAEEQMAGRGRFDRAWTSEAGKDLLFSVIFRPDAAQAPYVNMAAALSIRTTVREATGLQTAIKWPNDVKLAGRKVSGILVESAVTPRTPTSPLSALGGEIQRGGGLQYTILGVGLNVNSDPALTPEIAQTATSMRRETGRTFDRTHILIKALRDLDGRYALIRAGHSMREEWSSQLETLGRNVVVHWQNNVEEGRATGVDEMGNLILTKADGATRSVIAGEVTLQV